MDKLYMTKKKFISSEKDKYPKIRVSTESYERLAEVASNTGKTLASVANECLFFAIDRIVYVEE